MMARMCRQNYWGSNETFTLPEFSSDARSLGNCHEARGVVYTGKPVPGLALRHSDAVPRCEGRVFLPKFFGKEICATCCS